MYIELVFYRQLRKEENMCDISIIIPYHRNKKMLMMSLTTLNESINDFSNIEIIVVANNINSLEIQLELDPHKYKFLQFNENLFYPKAINAGANIATGEYLVFADPDIFYCEAWLKYMLDCYESHENVGCVGAKLINPDNNRILDFGIGYQGYHTLHSYRGLPYNHELCRNDINVQSICSALLLMKHSLYEKMNGFDFEMPYAYCDNDLCLRIREKGYNVLGAASSIAYHKGGTDPENSKYYAFNYLKEDCAAAFYYKNSKRYNNDFGNYFNISLQYFRSRNNAMGGYIFINLSTAYDWRNYMQIIQDSGLNILDISEGVISQRNIAKIDFTNVIDPYLVASKTPLIYFVDSFQSCSNNSLWFSLRDVHLDIIIDRNANYIPAWYIANTLL